MSKEKHVMRRALALVMTLALALCIVGCGKGKDKSAVENVNSDISADVVNPTSIPEVEPIVELTPREKVVEAFEATFGTEDSAQKYLKLKDLYSKITETGDLSAFLGIELADVEMMGDLGLEIAFAKDSDDKKMSLNLIGSATDGEFITLGISGDGTKSYVTLPQLFDGAVMIDSATAIEDLENNEALADLVDLEGIIGESGADAIDIDKIVNALKIKEYESTETLKRTFTSLLDEADVAEADNGWYSVTIKVADYMTLFNACTDVMEETLNGLAEAVGDPDAFKEDMTELREDINSDIEEAKDFEFEVKVLDGLVREIKVDKHNPEDEKEWIEFILKLNGEAHPMDKVDLNYSSCLGEEETVYDWELDDGYTTEFVYTEVENELHLEFDKDSKEVEFRLKNIEDDEVMQDIKLTGTCDAVVPGKLLKFDIRAEVSDEFSDEPLVAQLDVRLSSTAEVIQTGRDKVIDLVNLTETELEEFMLEIVGNLMQDPVIGQLMTVGGDSSYEENDSWEYYE